MSIILAEEVYVSISRHCMTCHQIPLMPARLRHHSMSVLARNKLSVDWTKLKSDSSCRNERSCWNTEHFDSTSLGDYPRAKSYSEHLNRIYLYMRMQLPYQTELTIFMWWFIQFNQIARMTSYSCRTRLKLAQACVLRFVYWISIGIFNQAHIDMAGGCQP